MCRPGYTHVAAWRGGRAAARNFRDAAPPGRVRLRLRTTPPGQARHRACRPARSAPFCRGVRIGNNDRASSLAFAHDRSGFAPGAALLPAKACLVQDAADRVGADPGQTIRCSAQGGSQRAQRPSRCAVSRPVRRAGKLGQDPPPLLLAIADRMTPATARRHRRQSLAVEPRHPTRDGVAMTTPRKLRRCRVALPVGNRQQPLRLLSTSYAGGTFAASARARATCAAGARRDRLSRNNDVRSSAFNARSGSA